MSFLTDHYKLNPVEIINLLIFQKTNRIAYLLKKVLYWLPGLLGLSIPIAMTFFALGGINDGGTLFQTAYALMVQFIPVALIAFVLVFAWEWDLVGAVAFIGLAIVELIWEFELFQWSNYLIITSIFLVLGVLFFFNWIYRTGKDKAA